ncbi:MAG: HEAT repeat domain-containing protein [Phycisphaerae bacterium]|nr:HEAT repeat domain-containing protein [Phycisphaerae bacterium]
MTAKPLSYEPPCGATRGLWVAAACGGLALLAACAPAATQDPHALRTLAMQYMTAAVTFQDNPVIRAQAIEGLQRTEGEKAVTWFREAINDEHPGVRFAACIALGTIRHEPSETLLRVCLADPDANVRVAAMFALRRLGDPGFVDEFGQIVRAHPDARVRRNAVLVLGRLEEPGAIALLRRAYEDDDESVRLQALESMALLGDKRAVEQILFYAGGGFGDRQAFALITLGRAHNTRAVDTLRYALEKAPYLESKLAAARALGEMGYNDGYKLALQSVEWNEPAQNLPDDPPENQIMRIRTQAAFALGAIGEPGALTALRKQMETPGDPRVQLAAAAAILDITQRRDTDSLTPLVPVTAQSTAARP